MTCTDGQTPLPDQPITHPRTYGAFAKKMRMFVFENEILAPEFIIRGFSGLAADFFSTTGPWLSARWIRCRPGGSRSIDIPGPRNVRKSAAINGRSNSCDGKWRVRDSRWRCHRNACRPATRQALILMSLEMHSLRDCRNSANHAPAIKKPKTRPRAGFLFPPITHSVFAFPPIADAQIRRFQGC